MDSLLPVTADSASLRRLRNFLARHLLEEIVPFWTRHAIDPAGGLNTCLRDDGSLINRQKWLWSQWRAVWVFARLYNQIDARPEWLDLALHIHRFASAHGWDAKVEGWRLLIDADGTELRGCESIYVDAFAIYGLVELGKATGDSAMADLARRTARSVVQRLQAPHDSIPHFPYPVPTGARVHGLPMMFSLILWELGQWLDDDEFRRAGAALSDEVFERHYQPDWDVIAERVSASGGKFPAPAGTAVVPGHVIEDMWFQIHVAREQGNFVRVREACRLMKRHAEIGWDAEYGGLFLAVDALGGKDIGWDFAEAKLWWPHTEALYAFLLAHEISGEPWALEWYNRIHEYSFRMYPVAEHGEWRQKLTRTGEPLTDTVALPVKDPFHLPRALLLCLEVLDRTIACGGQ
jgi:N-acylglucosamine 2-epimerase